MKLIKLISKLKNYYNTLDFKVNKIMHIGFKFSFIIVLIATYILYTYQSKNNNPNIFYIGLSLFKSGLTFGVTFFIFGFSFNTIKKQLGI